VKIGKDAWQVEVFGINGIRMNCRKTKAEKTARRFRMKKKILGLAVMSAHSRVCLPILVAIFFAACAATPPPAWDSSISAMQQAFPESEFIAQRGRGATRTAAEADATAAIARFLNSEVVSRIAVLEQVWERNGETGARTEIEAETFVQAQMQLFGIRHTPDAFFDRTHREWVTVAYINRSEAWQVYGPRFRQQAQIFASLFEAAENESDPFRKALRYTAAQDFVRSPDFRNTESLGKLLFPARMDAEFADMRTMLASLPQRAANARMNAPVFIDIPQDFESLVQGAFSRRFAALGFPVTNDRNAAAAVCHVMVEEGRQVRQLGIFYFPQVRAVISSPAGTLFTFSAEGGQQAAVTPDVAKRRAYRSR